MKCDIRLVVISPDEEVYHGLVDSIVLPGADGLFGILPRHAPMIALLGPGVARFTECGGGGRRWMALSGGFAEVRNNRVTLVADSAELAGAIDLERAEEARDRAERRLHHELEDQVDIPRAEASLRRALARIKAAAGGPVVKIG